MRAAAWFCLSAFLVSTCGCAIATTAPYDADLDARAVDAFACPPDQHVCGGGCVSSSALSTCGASCTPCVEPMHGHATCDGARCGVACDPGLVAWAEGCHPPPPRPIAPLSTSHVTSRRPSFHWATSAGTSTRVEICADRACARILDTIDTSETSAMPTSELPVGTSFWRVRSAGIDGAGPPSPTWQVAAGARSALVDASWGASLDVDGDGMNDLALGESAVVRIHAGRSDGVTATPVATLTLPGRDTIVWSLAASDVDGDGFSDLVVLGSTNLYVYPGGPTGVGDHPSTTVPMGAWGIWLEGAGDVNADGYADVIVAAMGRSVANVLLGSAHGLDTSAPLTLHGDAGREDVLQVGGAGDVNADGYADVITGRQASVGAHVYLGSSSGPPPAPTFELPASTSSATLGSVGCAGDVDGDGYADIVVGSDGADSIWLYRGTATGVDTTSTALSSPRSTALTVARTAGDVDGDGYADLIAGDAVRAYLFSGGADGVSTSPSVLEVGATSNVGSVGDVNGDGYGDVVLTSPDVFLLLGSATGLSTTPAAHLGVGIEYPRLARAW